MIFTKDAQSIFFNINKKRQGAPCLIVLMTPKRFL